MIGIQLNKFISKTVIFLVFALMLQMIFAVQVSHQNEIKLKNEDLLEDSFDNFEEKSLNTRQQVIYFNFKFKFLLASFFKLHLFQGS
jgi:hypothetical protein